MLTGKTFSDCAPAAPNARNKMRKATSELAAATRLHEIVAALFVGGTIGQYVTVAVIVSA